MTENPIFGRQTSELTSAENSHKKLFKEYLQSFERRNSDSSCVLNRSSSCEKINLAAEIKKLSERLMMLSSINSDLNNYNEKVEMSLAQIPSTNVTAVGQPENKPKESEKSAPIKKADKPKIDSGVKTAMKKLKNGNVSSNSLESPKETSGSVVKKSTFNRSSSVITNSTFKSSSTANEDGALSERLKLLDETPKLSKKLLKTESIENRTNTLKTAMITTSTTTTVKSSGGCGGGVGTVGGAPWPITTKRTKFRVTQMSRDVPMNSPNTHQTVFLEEAVTTTKDCLLHLLEKYNDTESRAHTSLGTMGRHQSISEGYGISDNLEYRSMNSLNFFFQRHANSGKQVKQIQAQIESKNGHK